MPDETDVDVVTHWGVRLPGSSQVRWDPGYQPYTEGEARSEAMRIGGTLVTRRQTITTVTTEWVTP